MVLAEFDFWDAVLAGIWIFFLVIFFWLLITVFADLFRDDETSGWGKAAWILFLVIVPFLGTLVYFIFRGKDMQARTIADQKAAKDSFDAYVREQAATVSPAEQLETLAGLHEKGKLSDDEFAAAKAKLL